MLLLLLLLLLLIKETRACGLANAWALELRMHSCLWGRACVMECLRRGPGTDIEPLADVFPSSQQPAWESIPAERLSAALPLQPGTFALREVGMLHGKVLQHACRPAGHAHHNERCSRCAADMQAEKGVLVAPSAYQAEDGGAVIKKEKKVGKKRKLDAPS